MYRIPGSLWKTFQSFWDLCGQECEWQAQCGETLQIILANHKSLLVSPTSPLPGGTVAGAGGGGTPRTRNSSAW